MIAHHKSSTAVWAPLLGTYQADKLKSREDLACCCAPLSLGRLQTGYPASQFILQAEIPGLKHPLSAFRIYYPYPLAAERQNLSLVGERISEAWTEKGISSQRNKSDKPYQTGASFCHSPPHALQFNNPPSLPLSQVELFLDPMFLLRGLLRETEGPRL